jgi:hypothetical protein
VRLLRDAQDGVAHGQTCPGREVLDADVEVDVHVVAGRLNRLPVGDEFGGRGVHEGHRRRAAGIRAGLPVRPSIAGEPAADRRLDGLWRLVVAVGPTQAEGTDRPGVARRRGRGPGGVELVEGAHRPILP